MSSDEAAEDQGHRPTKPSPPHPPQPGVSLPSDYECEVGAVGVAAARKAIADAQMAKAVGADWNPDDNG